MGGFHVNGFSLFAWNYMFQLEKLGAKFDTFADIIPLASDKWEVTFFYSKIVPLSLIFLFFRSLQMIKNLCGRIKQYNLEKRWSMQDWNINTNLETLAQDGGKKSVSINSDGSDEDGFLEDGNKCTVL